MRYKMHYHIDIRIMWILQVHLFGKEFRAAGRRPRNAGRGKCASEPGPCSRAVPCPQNRVDSQIARCEAALIAAVSGS